MLNTLSGKTVTGARIFFGLAFFVFGLNGFLHFIPQPPPPPEAGAFLGGLAASGYMFPFIKGTEVLVGLLLLSGLLVPLALVVAAPIVLNIVAFHAFLAPAGMLLPLALLAAGLFLAWAYRDSFRGVLEVNAKPVRRSAGALPSFGSATGSGGLSVPGLPR